jgi:hypothetical protein
MDVEGVVAADSLALVPLAQADHGSGVVAIFNTPRMILLADYAYKEQQQLQLTENKEINAMYAEQVVVQAERAPEPLEHFGLADAAAGDVVQYVPKMNRDLFFWRDDSQLVERNAPLLVRGKMEEAAAKWAHMHICLMRRNCTPLGKVPVVKRPCFDAERCLHSDAGRVDAMFFAAFNKADRAF